ncbi:MAG: type II toxin-antitoxin system prevent-host-death family antitoxin [Roseomonas sp.]|nr:type II toxin-antitoxin system prevent-host-death family antitoxin [Roseomonas sp.]
MPNEIKVSVRELREHLSDHIRRVSGGESVVITR